MGADSLAESTLNALEFVCPICLPKPENFGFQWNKNGNVQNWPHKTDKKNGTRKNTLRTESSVLKNDLTFKNGVTLRTAWP